MLSVLALVLSGWTTSYAQAMEAEVPGDHFSLEGALELFKKSSSPEDFERRLNSPDEKVNNLDLNGDGYVDYIRVHDRMKGNVHAFILQAVISEHELQDIAVIELEKMEDGRAVLQIVGDEDIYGVTTIIEPTREVRTYAGTQTTRTVVNVWTWPVVRYVYGPSYTVWVSPWQWHYHPVWWHRWRPVTYVHYHTIWVPYHRHYVVCDTRRVVHAHALYRPYRKTSVIVHRRYNDVVTRYRVAHPEGHVRNERRDDRARTRSAYQRTTTRDEQPAVTRDDQPATTGDYRRASTTPRTSDNQVRQRTTVERRLPSAMESRSPVLERTATTTQRQRQVSPAQPQQNFNANANRREVRTSAPVQQTPPPARTRTPQQTRTAPARQSESMRSIPQSRTREMQRIAPQQRRSATPQHQRSFRQ